MGPTLAGFIAFVRTIMQVPTGALPDDSPYFQPAYDFALMVVNDLLAGCASFPTSPSLYALAVYNLAGDYLVNFTPDVQGSTYFADLRASLKINTFVAGVVQSAGDEGTNESLLVPDFMKNLTMANLQQLKTPWGRQYMAIAQSFGTLWGMN